MSDQEKQYKQCPRCRLLKEFACFYKHKDGGTGSYCKDCTKRDVARWKLSNKERSRAWRCKNKAAIKRQKHESYLRHRDRILAKQAVYNQKNKTAVAERRRVYWINHRESGKERNRKYYLEHREVFAERNRKYRLEHREALAKRNREYRLERREQFRKENAMRGRPSKSTRALFQIVSLAETINQTNPNERNTNQKHTNQ